MMLDIDEFVHGYLDGILFTESLEVCCDRCPNCGGPDGYPSAHEVGCPFRGDSSLLNYGCSREDFAPAAVAEIRAECEDFIAANERALTAYVELRGDVRCSPDSFGRSSYSASECAGTDFWLSRNGHGSGYFDRGNEPVFGELQDAARVYGETHVFFDGGEITV